LREWGARFEANRDKVEAMYDAKFCRMWEFYLISAEMMFRTGSQLVFHMQLSRRRDAAPITRDYIGERQRQLREKESALRAGSP
jgi:cyclopropane-fatty-acyl-phospholipid synthase